MNKSTAKKLLVLLNEHDYDDDYCQLDDRPENRVAIYLAASELVGTLQDDVLNILPCDDTEQDWNWQELRDACWRLGHAYELSYLLAQVQRPEVAA